MNKQEKESIGIGMILTGLTFLLFILWAKLFDYIGFIATFAIFGIVLMIIGALNLRASSNMEEEDED